MAYENLTKDELIHRLEARSRNGNKTPSWLPVNKKGIKVGTSAAYAGGFMLFNENIGGTTAWQMIRAKNYNSAALKMRHALTKGMAGKILLAGGVVAAVGKYTRFKNIGPLQAH